MQDIINRHERCKRCSKCEATKPLSGFGKKASQPDGLQRWCKECSRAGNKSWRGRNREKVSAAKKAYCEANREEIRSKKKAYYAENREAILREKAKYFNDNRGPILEAASVYRRANRQRLSEYFSGYFRANRSKYVANSAARKARKLTATPAWADQEKIRALYTESARLSLETGVEHHVDHIVPLRSKLVSGLHWHGNMRIITASENISKGNRHWPDMP